MKSSAKIPKLPGQAYNWLGLPEQVRLARPLASELLIEGIDFTERHTSNGTFDRICELAGVPHPMSLLEEKLTDQEQHAATFIIEASMAAALALGIALGQCLTPNALKGGAR